MRHKVRAFFGSLLCIIASILFGAVILIGMVGATDSDGATRLLQANGFTNIQITGLRPFMRGEGDFYSTGFEATGPTGQRVSGAVTGGIFKGSTIRFD